MPIGTLYVADFEGVEDGALLDDRDRLASMLEQVIRSSGLSRVGNPVIHRFSPHGLTYISVLEQSHISAHTWPEHRHLSVDLFGCGDAAIGERTVEVLRRAVACRHVNVRVLRRGPETS
jgi:S-adenosylmethionine decarboxylase